jgi:uncharacterized protein YndB with AHSA1/START domain
MTAGNPGLARTSMDSATCRTDDRCKPVVMTSWDRKHEADMEPETPLVAKAELLIRKPAADVFDAFVDPDIITKFWFDKSSGRLESGKSVQWRWELFDLSIDVQVREILEDQRICIEWGTNNNNVTTVEWTFTPRTDDTTYVSIVVSGFSGSADKIVSEALDSTGGFNLVLAAAKAWLEHGIQLNIVADRF